MSSKINNNESQKAKETNKVIVLTDPSFIDRTAKKVEKVINDYEALKSDSVTQVFIKK